MKNDDFMEFHGIEWGYKSIETTCRSEIRLYILSTCVFVWLRILNMHSMIYIYTYIDLKLTHVLLIYAYIIIYLGKLQYFTNLKSSAILYRIVVPTNHHYSGVAVRLLWFSPDMFGGFMGPWGHPQIIHFWGGFSMKWTIKPGLRKPPFVQVVRHWNFHAVDDVGRALMLDPTKGAIGFDHQKWRISSRKTNTVLFNDSVRICPTNMGIG